MSGGKQRFWKIAKWFIGIACGLLLFIVAALLILPLDKLAENEVRVWLKTHEIPLEFDVKGLNLRGISLENIRFSNSEDAALDSLSVEYTLKSLWSRRAGILRANGLNLIVRQQEDGSFHLVPTDPIIAKFSKAENDTPGFTPPPLPFDKIELQDALLTIIRKEGEPIQVVFSAELNEDYSGSIHVLGAHVPLADGSKIEITDMVLERENTDVPFTFSIKRLAHNTEHKAYFTPMHALGEIELTKENTHANGIIVISDLLDRWVLNLSGQTDMQAGSWNVAIDQPEVFFESGILQPDQLFPFLRGMVKSATGSFAINGYARQEPGKEMESGGAFTFRDVTLTVKNTPIKKANGKIEFASLFPLATKGQQVVKVEEIVLGLPLSGGNLKFTLDKTGKVELAPSSWNWANGQLMTSKVTTDLETLTIHKLTLSAKQLAVEQLLASLLTSGFSATGNLDGTLPLVFKNGKAMIQKGRLATPGGGIIRYIPPEGEAPLQKGQSFQTDILLQAVENFHYDELSFDINSKDERIIEVMMHLRGRNPELYDGKLVELNINLTGNLLEAVQNTMDIYSLSDRLEEQLAP